MFAVDIVTKIAVFNVQQGVEATNSQDLIHGFVAITLRFNENAAFGLGFENPAINRVLYIVIALIAAGIMTFIYVYKFKKLKSLYKVCLMLMLVGALGNCVDRLFYSFSDYRVVDWIDFYGIWPYVFNLADSCIVVGTIMLIVLLIIDEVKDYKKNKPAKVAHEEKALSIEEQRRKDEIEASKNSK